MLWNSNLLVCMLIFYKMRFFRNTVFIEQILPQYFFKLFRRRGKITPSPRSLNWSKLSWFDENSTLCSEGLLRWRQLVWWPQVYIRAKWRPCFLWALPEHKQMCSHTERSAGLILVMLEIISLELFQRWMKFAVFRDLLWSLQQDKERMR